MCVHNYGNRSLKGICIYSWLYRCFYQNCYFQYSYKTNLKGNQTSQMNCVQLRLIIPSFGTSNRSSDRVMHQDKKSKENNSKSCKIMDLKLRLNSFYQWMKIQHFLQKVFQVTSNKRYSHTEQTVFR